MTARIFARHRTFINSRGDEAMGSTWSYADATLTGRQEKVGRFCRKGIRRRILTKWWNWHDSYASNPIDKNCNKVVDASKATLNL